MKKTKGLFSGTSQCPGIQEESMASMLLNPPRPVARGRLQPGLGEL